MTDQNHAGSTTHGDDEGPTTKSTQTEGDAIQRQGQAKAPDRPSQAEGSRETVDEDLNQQGK